MSTLQAPTARRDEILAEVARRLGDRKDPDHLREEIEAFCCKWQITEFCLFGSVLRDDFGAESDVDVLVSFAPDAGHRWFDRIEMRDELGGLFGRRVDLVSKRAVLGCDNYVRREGILGSAEALYAA